MRLQKVWAIKSMDKLVFSQDGSHTIVSDRFGVSYHSKHGAIQETETVFLKAGLEYQIENGLENIRILEMGFGTGLNAIMTFIQETPKIVYTTLEAYPISEAQYTALNYPEILNLDAEQKDIFYKMHQSDSGVSVELNEDFTFTKHIQKIEDYETTEKFDIIYYDAFAPNSQEELWTPELMANLYQKCNNGAVLVTYCAKGSFKRALKSAGFEVVGLDGPIGKREMTRAHKR